MYDGLKNGQIAFPEQQMSSGTFPVVTASPLELGWPRYGWLVGHGSRHDMVVSGTSWIEERRRS